MPQTSWINFSLCPYVLDDLVWAEHKLITVHNALDVARCFSWIWRLVAVTVVCCVGFLFVSYVLLAYFVTGFYPFPLLVSVMPWWQYFAMNQMTILHLLPMLWKRLYHLSTYHFKNVIFLAFRCILFHIIPLSKSKVILNLMNKIVKVCVVYLS